MAKKKVVRKNTHKRARGGQVLVTKLYPLTFPPTTTGQPRAIIIDFNPAAFGDEIVIVPGEGKQ